MRLVAELHQTDLGADRRLLRRRGWGAGGLIGYGGTVRLDDSGQRVAGGWRVALTVPGERATFAPGPVGAMQPGGSVTFDFWFGGVLSAQPYGCMVNGHPCN
jgi:hypothetical protein